MSRFSMTHEEAFRLALGKNRLGWMDGMKEWNGWREEGMDG